MERVKMSTFTKACFGTCVFCATIVACFGVVAYGASVINHVIHA